MLNKGEAMEPSFLRRRRILGATLVLITGLFAVHVVVAKSDLERGIEATGKALEDVRKTVEKAGNDGGKAIAKGFEDSRKTVEKALSDALRAGDHLGGEVCKEICKIGCGGEENIKKNRCSCDCSAGASTDNEGNVSGMDPTTGETYPAPQKQAEPDLRSLGQFEASLDPRGMWWIAHSPLRKQYEIHRDYIGKAVPTGVVRFHMPVVGGEVREPTSSDPAGGVFWSPRRDKKYPAGRLHASFDVLNAAGTPVYAPISGRITGLNNPGTGKLTGLVIQQDLGQDRYVRAVVYYVEVDKGIVQRLARGETVPIEGGNQIGIAQDVRQPSPQGYGPNMRQHLHVSLFDQNGNYLGLDEDLQRVVADLVVKKAPGKK